MSSNKLRVLVSSLVFILLLSGVATADEFHYVNHLIGDRATGMSGAYTGVSDDVSGLYYNPAGIMYSTGRSLSASVNAYFQETKKYDNVIGGQGWERKSNALLPNFFGVIQPTGSLRFGFSYAVPDSISESQDQVFLNVPSSTPGVQVSKYVINFNNDDNTYEFGPTLAAELGKETSVGFTLYFYQRKNRLVLNQFLVKNTAPVTYEWSNTYHDLNEWGVRPILGFMWSPAEKLSFGLALSKVMLLRSSTNDQLTKWDSSTGIVSETNTGFDDKRKYPVQLNAGAAYFVSSSLLIDADVKYSSKVTDSNFGDRVSVVNGAVGAEYYLTKETALRGGVYTDLANTPQLVGGMTGQEEHVNIYGAGLSLSTFTRNTSITFGGSMTRGKGNAQVVADSANVQNVTLNGWTLFLSSSYSY